MVVDTLPPSRRRAAPRAATALLQLLVAAAAEVALAWVSLRLLVDALSQADRYGFLPPAVMLLVDLAVSGLSLLPMVALTALWLRELAGAPVPREFLALVRSVLGAWSIALGGYAAGTLASVLLLPLLAGDFPAEPAVAWWHAAVPSLLLLAIATLLLPRVLARLTGVPAASLRGNPLRRLACFGLLAIPLAADMAAGIASIDHMLHIVAFYEPWIFLGALYAQGVLVTLLAALAVLAAWRLLGPDLRRRVPAA